MAVDPKGKDVRAMPAGHERDEQLKINADNLEAKAQTEFANQGAIKPEAFKIENEVAQHLGANSRDPREWGRGRVRNMVAGMGYLWPRDDPDAIAEVENRFADVLSMSDCDYQGVIWSGYEIVRGDMPEARERMDARGYRVIADTILARAPQILIDRWQRAVDIQNRAKELAVGESLMGKADEIARRYNVPPNYVIALAGNLEPGELRRMGRQNLREIQQKDRIIADLRAGTIPQMEVRK
jgi:hypothetical protein